jgi:hypothetical protein
MATLSFTPLKRSSKPGTFKFKRIKIYNSLRLRKRGKSYAVNRRKKKRNAYRKNARECGHSIENYGFVRWRRRSVKRRKHAWLRRRPCSFKMTSKMSKGVKRTLQRLQRQRKLEV